MEQHTPERKRKIPRIYFVLILLCITAGLVLQVMGSEWEIAAYATGAIVGVIALVQSRGA